MRSSCPKKSIPVYHIGRTKQEENQILRVGNTHEAPEKTPAAAYTVLAMYAVKLFPIILCRQNRHNHQRLAAAIHVYGFAQHSLLLET